MIWALLPEIKPMMMMNARMCKIIVAVSLFVMFISDAAHRIHPLAGQGVNLGFADVACLRRHCVDAVLQGQDIGLQWLF